MGDIVRIFALGGLDEDGKNLYCCQVNDDIYVFDAGIKFPTRNTPGIDYIMPDCSYLIKNKEHVKGYFISHGHDDQIGALCFIYKKAKAPIYCSKVTASFIKLFCEHSDLDYSELDLKIVSPSCEFVTEGRRVRFFQLPHNMAQTSGISLETSLGNVVYTSDFIIDYNTPKDYSLDLNMLSKIGEENTLALLTPSSYSNRPGYTSPGHRLTPHVRNVFENCTGRVFISIFSTNIFNIQEMIDFALSKNRKIVSFDEETEKIIKTMQADGLLQFNPTNYVPYGDIARHRDEELCILICGFSLKLLNKIYLFAKGKLPNCIIKMKPTDAFVFASPASLSLEVQATKAIDEVYKTDCNVIFLTKKNFFNMNPSEEDLSMLLKILKPKYYIPTKGSYRYLISNANMANSFSSQLNHNSIFILDNGNVLYIDATGAKTLPVNMNVPAGSFLIDGKGVDSLSTNSTLLTDRQKLGEDGIVAYSCTINEKESSITSNIDIIYHGFKMPRNEDVIIQTLIDVIKDTIGRYLVDKTGPFNKKDLEVLLEGNLSRETNRLVKKEPLIIGLIKVI